MMRGGGGGRNDRGCVGMVLYLFTRPLGRGLGLQMARGEIVVGRRLMRRFRWQRRHPYIIIYHI